MRVPLDVLIDQSNLEGGFHLKADFRVMLLSTSKNLFTRRTEFLNFNSKPAH